MTEARFELALVADDAESLAFPRRHPEVDLHTYGVQEEREPSGHAKIQTKSSGYLCVAAEVGCDCDPVVVGAVGGEALREVGFERLSAVLEK